MNIRSVLIFTAVGLATLSTFSQVPPPSTAEKSKVTTVSQPISSGAKIELFEGKVLSVENGDTITVRTNDHVRRSIRLQAIDAPDDGQKYFKESKKNLSKLVQGKLVKVVGYSSDTSSLLIGTVFQNGRDVGLIQLERGLAWHFKRYAYEQTAAGRKSYSDAQSNASVSQIGIWNDESPVAPWVIRGESAVPATKIVNAASTTQTASANTPAVINGRKYILGPRGGCYYVAEGGRKVYVSDKTLCETVPKEPRPQH